MVITNDKGMVTSEIMVVRAFIRKMKSTITTNRAPSAENVSHCIWALNKTGLAKNVVESFTSAGSVFVDHQLLDQLIGHHCTAGCFVTVINTASLPRSEATPSLGVLFPTVTSAIFSSSTGVLFTYDRCFSELLQCWSTAYL